MIQKEMSLKFDYQLPKMNKYTGKLEYFTVDSRELQSKGKNPKKCKQCNPRFSFICKIFAENVFL